MGNEIDSLQFILWSCFMYVLTIFVLLTVLSKSQDLVWEDNLLRFIAQPQPLKETSIAPCLLSGQVCAAQPDSLWSWPL